MIVSNITCMKIEHIRLKHAKSLVWSFKISHYACSYRERMTSQFMQTGNTSRCRSKSILTCFLQKQLSAFFLFIHV
ncbi:hypothetical protein LDENG_00205930 [Lucifuga dentata]|nr:hypothetical protein LDENG_00205930 [Lucifuga dentata]